MRAGDLLRYGDCHREGQIRTARDSGGRLPPIAALVFPRIMGRKKAMELILAGDTISAQEALSLGLVNKVVPKPL